MQVPELVGYLAALLVFATFYVKTMIPLRILALCSNCAFILYGFLDGLYPVLILHIFLLPVNGYRLREMLRLVRQVKNSWDSNLDSNWLKSFSTMRSTSAGTVLFRKGDRATAMYVVVSGLYRLAELGIALKTGEIVGELALLEPHHARTQSLECVEDGAVLEISYEQVKQLFYQNPEFGFYLLQLVAKRLFENAARLEAELSGCRMTSPAELPT